MSLTFIRAKVVNNNYSDWSRIQVAEGRRFTSQFINITHKLRDFLGIFTVFISSVFFLIF